jgi:hypothetical protein
MPSITTWNRIEPRARSANLADGLAARVHDPLWLLLRQWQVGEFAGHDGGSPLKATASAGITALDRCTIGSGAALSLDGTVPLEALVEREVVRPANAADDVRQAAEAGLHFSRMLATANIAPAITAAYLAAYPIGRQNGIASELSTVVAGRAIDGVKLFAELNAAGSALPALPALPPDARDAVLAITRDWSAWYRALFSEPAQTAAWDADRFEYRFVLSSSAAASSYSAQEYAGGSVDWYTFDRLPASVQAPSPAVSPAVVAVVAPVTFRGMPARRFWEMEDAAVDIGGLLAAAEDIGRLLLREFALIYGNDWFQFPLIVAAGSRIEIAALSVADTFGVVTVLPHYSAVDGAFGAWRAFALTADGGAPALSTAAGAAQAVSHELIVTASALASVDGPAVEDVMLIRDELATMVWGIERTVDGAAGIPIDRVTSWNTALPVAEPPSADAVPQYRLGTTVPDYWIPFMPVATPPTGVVKLVRAKLPTSPAGALSRVLTDIDGGLFLEEVPREGVHVQRVYRSARAASGATSVWLSRKRRVGTGEGRSGLAFDILTS